MNPDLKIIFSFYRKISFGKEFSADKYIHLLANIKNLQSKFLDEWVEKRARKTKNKFGKIKAQGGFNVWEFDKFVFENDLL